MSEIIYNDKVVRQFSLVNHFMGSGWYVSGGCDCGSVSMADS